MYFLLVGHPPFPEGTLSQRLLAHQNQKPASILVERPDAPRDLVAICEQMMSKKADERQQSATEVAQQLALKQLNQSPESPFDNLSEREIQVVIMITSGQKVPDIATQLFLSTKTVNSYRYRIFEKLGVNSDVDLTHMALRYKLIDRPDSE